MAIRGQSNERFGNLPLPIELDGRATEGELMVGRTTGHIYVRNGGKNLSKTVEIEEFLKALRMGALNWVRQSGNFIPELIENNWFISSNLPNESKGKLEVIEEDGIKLLRWTGFTEGNAQFNNLTNMMNRYHKAKFLTGKQYCLSVELRVNKDIDMTFQIIKSGTGDGEVLITNKRLYSGWNKVEIVFTPTKDSVDADIKLVVGNVPGVIVDLKTLQLEPGDRSFAWRPSFYDMIELMEFKDGKLKENLENQIQDAIRDCKEYTNTEIEKLGDKFAEMVRNAITECKEYTNTEITKVNNRITNEVAELEQKDRMERAHLILGNNDWTKYANLMNGSKSLITYSEDELGVMVTSNSSESWVELLKEFPIFKDTKYAIRVKVKQIEGIGKFYCGVKSLDGDLEHVTTDNALSYNYGVANNVELENGREYEFSTIFEGYNTVSENNHNKFDPYAQFFRLIFLTNYGGYGKVVIKGIEIFEIPKCLHNALTVASPSKDGLMSIEGHNKLETVEWHANNYSHPTGDGNMHVPATGTENDRKVLTAGKTPGSAKWETLPDDIDKVDGKHANEFVWVHEEPTTIEGGQIIAKLNQVYKTALSPGENITGYIRIECAKAPFGNYFSELKFSLYSGVYGSAIIDVGFNLVSATNITSRYAFSSNRALTRESMFIKCENERPVLYIGSNTFRNLVVSIDQYITFWTGDFENHKDWNVSIVNSLPSNVFEVKFNSELNANYLNNRASDTYADKQGAKVDNYITPTPDKKVANINTRGSNENSWLVLDPTTTNNRGLYYNGSDQVIQVGGEKDLPPDTIAHIGDNHLQHYHDMKTGDVYHRGNLESNNIQLGNFRIVKNDSKKSLDFILD